MPRRHPPDRLLLAAAQGEARTASPTVSAHILGCARCATAVHHMRTAEAHLDGLFGAVVTPAAPPPRAPARAAHTHSHARGLHRRSVRAVAALAACLLLVLVVPQLRATIAQRMQAVLRGSGQQPPPAAVPAQGEAQELHLSISPRSPVLLVDITTTQTRGAVIVSRRGDTHEIVLRVTDASGEESVTAAADGFRINAGSGAPTYTLTVPPGITDVRLRIGGSVIPVQLEGGTFRFDFAAR